MIYFYTLGFLLICLRASKEITSSYETIINRICFSVLYKKGQTSFEFRVVNLQDSHSILPKRENVVKDGIVFQYDHTALKCSMCSTLLTINENHTFPFTYFFLSTSKKKDFYLGLGISQKDSASIQMQLKQQKKISRASFGLTPLAQETIKPRGKIIFGGFPEEMTIGKRKITCRSNKNWGCFLKKISIGHLHSLTVNQYAYFQNQDVFILGPKKIIQNFFEAVFTDLIKEKKCFNSTDFYNNNAFFCSVDTITTFPDLEITFDEYKILINGSMMFKVEESLGIFKVGVSPDDRWVLGLNFFLNFFTEFNEEDPSITFYGDFSVEPLPFLAKTKALIFGTLSIALLGILLTGFILLNPVSLLKKENHQTVVP